MDLGTVLDNVASGFFSPISARFLKAYYGLKPSRGIDIPEEDWDYLIVLDACRYDVFEQYNSIEGTLSPVKSKGAHSKEWLKQNFTNYYEDIVYVSGNVFVSPTGSGGFRSDEHFHSVYRVYMEDESEAITHPASIVETGKKALSNHPDKRIIFHFMQPHTPYIGEYKIESSDSDRIGPMKKEGVSDEELWKAYVSNFKFVQQYVEELLEYLDGEIVVTADHGESFGEKFVYNHHPGVHTRELTRVPWLEIHKDESRSLDLKGVEI